jgi:predicted nucleic acid-binding protein
MIAPIEVASALNRLKTEKRISLHQYQTIKNAFFTDLSDMTVVTIDSQTVKKSIQQIESHCLKSLDAIHVANAIQWEPDIFVSSDVKQVGAAKKAGLHVKMV